MSVKRTTARTARLSMTGLFLSAALIMAAALQAQEERISLDPKFVPAKAAPGAEVTLEVAVDVIPGWHVYGRDDPSYPIKLVVKEAAGLVAKGAPLIPEGKEHEAYGIKNFWLQGSVTLKQGFVVPAGAAAGKLKVSGIVDFMACDENSCDPPTKMKWSATLTVEGGAQPAGQPGTQPGTQPAKQEPAGGVAGLGTLTGDRKVTAKARFDPATARPGEQVRLVARVAVREGFHLYGALETTGIRPAIETVEGNGLQPVGDPQLPPGELHSAGGLDQYYLVGEFDVAQAFVVPAGAEPGVKAWKGGLSYMVCDENLCDPLDQIGIDAGLTVEKGPVRAEFAPTLAPTTNQGKPGNESGGSPSDAGTGKPGTAKPGTGETPAADLRTWGTVGDGKLREPRFADSDSGMGGSLWGLILLCIGGALVALVMPCTYPMIPITFSFFTKQAEKRGGNILSLALTYGLGIVVIFVLIGVLVGEVITGFATHWITNLVIGVAFVVFALTLFGLVNLQPPAFLTNVAGRAGRGGGLFGVFLMGATLVITSFTCTMPIVGSLLAGVGTMGRGKVALGMAVFGLTMALPFVLLALLPGRVKALPRSGEWMNTLKVSLGYIELAAALKFLSNADVSLQLGWCPREVFLLLWAFLFTLLALFLFGNLRGRGVPLEGVGATRHVFGGLSFALAFYMLFGTMGYSLDRVMTAFEPPYRLRKLDEHEIVKDDMQLAMQKAREQKKLLLVNFTGFA